MGERSGGGPVSGLSYAGIGSRQSPPRVLELMARIAASLARDGLVLRSGAADGADAAFERGCDEAGGLKQIFLPWRRFNGHPSLLVPAPAAYLMAEIYHPNWAACSKAVRSFHARNCHQVLGPDLDDPVSMVICYTPNGQGGGGTGQAIRIAKDHGISVFDLGHQYVVDDFMTALERE